MAKPLKKRRFTHPKRTVFGRMRAYFFAGILVTAPIGISLWITWGIITFFDTQIVRLIPPKYNPETYLPISLPGLGLVLTIIVLTIVGWLAAGLLGRWLVRISGQVMARMPIVRNIYSAIKQVMETILAQKSNAFRHVVLFEYPRRGIWSMGFVTGGTSGEVQNVIDSDMINVFVPTTPNPTSGFLLFVPKSDVYYLNMSSEDGFKMLVSTGIVTPPDLRPEEQRTKPVIFTKDNINSGFADVAAQISDKGLNTESPPFRDDGIEPIEGEPKG